MPNIYPNHAPMPRAFLAWDGTAYRVCSVDAAGQLQVDIIASALPAGAATAANQATMITALQLIDDLRAALDSVGTDEIDVNVEASVLPTGAATQATLATLATEAKLELVRLLLVSLEAKDFATQVTLAALLTELQLKADLTETQPVSAASLPLPTGAATAVKQQLAIDKLTAIATAVFLLPDRLVTIIANQTALGQRLYEDTLEILVTGNPSGADGYITTAAVPADEVWVITHIVVNDDDQALTSLHADRVSGGTSYCFGSVVRAVPAAEYVEWDGWQWAKEDDTIRVYFIGAQAADTCHAWLTGHKIAV